mmetsp:Transcript_1483/g.2781  ORF Transcript_1483/g.2781 Transcript_1483/m.2781 type:complete len:178 (-) Transcript_1483:137-670(-)
MGCSQCTGRSKVPMGEELKSYETSRNPVFLNIYDILMANYSSYSWVSVGVYHTGVQVHNEEYSFAGHRDTEHTGLKITDPRDTTWIHDAMFREVVPMGYTDKSRDEVRKIYNKLKSQYRGPSYNVLDLNCNHFTRHFLQELGIKKRFPGFITAVSDNAAHARYCLPPAFRRDLRDQG